MHDGLPKGLVILSEAHRALARAATIEEAKALRDKAEAARKFAQCAKMGLEMQNQFAEFKLSCERKAGKMLAELGVRPGRPGKNKRSHDGTILAELGINKNQSSRWQQEARVPQELFERYLSTARQEGKEVTARGLLRMAQQHRAALAADGDGIAKSPRRRRDFGPMRCLAVPKETVDGDHGSIEVVLELLEHHKLLSDNLRDFCERELVSPMLVQRRTVARVLQESTELLQTLLRMLQGKVYSARKSDW